MQTQDLAVKLSPGVSRHLASWLAEHRFPIERCWLLLYPQAVEHGLAESLRLQLLDAQTTSQETTSQDIFPSDLDFLTQEMLPIALAPDGLLTIDKARSCCERIWSDWHAARIHDPVLIAIGGGTVMDLAKLVRWLPSNDECNELQRLDDAAWFERMFHGHADFKRCPLILMPSTSGTGSEATAYATIWGAGEHREKLSFTGATCFGDVALIDYELTLTCPLALTRDCGLDALSHALDALWNRHANDNDRGDAIHIASNIVSILPKLLDRLDDASLRKSMSEAALDAGHLIARTQTSLIHALSYPLTSKENLAHGLACAQWIAAVAGLACKHSPDMLTRLNTIWSMQAKDSNELEERLCEWLNNMGVVSRWFEKAGVDPRLHDALSQERGKNFL